MLNTLFEGETIKSAVMSINLEIFPAFLYTQTAENAKRPNKRYF
jgi:hypothetical protein